MGDPIHLASTRVVHPTPPPAPRKEPAGSRCRRRDIGFTTWSISEGVPMLTAPRVVRTQNRHATNDKERDRDPSHQRHASVATTGKDHRPESGRILSTCVAAPVTAERGPRDQRRERRPGLIPTMWSAPSTGAVDLSGKEASRVRRPHPRHGHRRRRLNHAEPVPTFGGQAERVDIHPASLSSVAGMAPSASQVIRRLSCTVVTGDSVVLDVPSRPAAGFAHCALSISPSFIGYARA